MRRTPNRSRGYTLIELLVVLVIVGILAMVGVNTLGDRPAGAVRSVLDEIEGVIAAAHKRCVATGKDVDIVVGGTWSSATPFVLAYGETTDNSGAAVTTTTILNNGKLSPDSFRFRSTDRDHNYAGVVLAGSDWWGTAATGNDDINSVNPFQDATSGFNALINDPSSDAANLSKLSSVRISGYSKRFTTKFYIAVVGLRNGKAQSAGPKGLIVVLDNGASIYKFYNPGSGIGNGKWRRI